MQLYDFKNSYQMLIIYTKLYDFKNSYQMLIIYTKLYDFKKLMIIIPCKEL